METLAEQFCSHWDHQQSVAPNMLLGPHVSQIREVLAFVDGEPSAGVLKSEMQCIFKTTNWLLHPESFQKFVQALGEAQFWMMAKARGVNLQPIPRKKSARKVTAPTRNSRCTPDFRLADSGTNAPCFEVKTFSVIGGIHNLKQINEESFDVQLSLREQVAEGKRIAVGVQVAEPHGPVEDGKHATAIIRNLIDKTNNNFESCQFQDAPTCLVLNLLLIDAHWTGNATLRPRMFGYPHPRSVHSGALWSLAFGKMGDLVFGVHGVEGELEREGLLEAHPDIRALLLIVHGLGQSPTIFGLKRSLDDDLWQEELGDLADAFFKLVGDDWNDDTDTNGTRLTQH